MYVCICAGVTENQIKSAVARNEICSLRDLCKQFGVARQCGTCCHAAKDVLRQALDTSKELLEGV
jgi:bacterioferritin-associated ferredoxin